MTLSRIRTAYFASLALAVVGVVLVLAAGPHFGDSTTTVSNGVTVTSTGADRPGLLTFGVIVLVVAGLITLFALISALVLAARAQQWVWFILLLLFSGISLLVLIVTGPQWARAGSSSRSLR